MSSKLQAVESNKLSIMPTQGVIEYFINSLRTPSTMKTYTSTLKTFFTWVKKDLKSVTPFDAIEFSSHQKENYAEATVQNRIATLNEFFRFCKEVGLIDKNPFAVVKQSAPPNRAAERFLTEKELNKLLDALHSRGQKHYVLGLLLASLGLRISEAANLSHCDFIEVPSGGIEVNLLRKGNSRQLVPLRDDVWQIVREFIGHGPNSFNKQALFLNPSGNRASVVTLRTWIKDASRKAKITKSISPHWLRHSTASHLLDKGASLENVAWLLNHANVSTTSRYLHPTDKDISGKMPIKVRND